MVTPTKKQTGFSLENATFYVSLLLLAAVIGAFFYLGYSIDRKNEEANEISAQAALAKSKDEKALETKIFLAQQKLSDFSGLIAERKTGAGFFGKFETLVLPEIYFSECKLDLKQMTAGLTGHAKSFQSLGQQILAFENSQDTVASVKLGKVEINSEGGIDFEVQLGIESAAIIAK